MIQWFIPPFQSVVPLQRIHIPVKYSREQQRDDGEVGGFIVYGGLTRGQRLTSSVEQVEDVERIAAEEGDDVSCILCSLDHACMYMYVLI